MGTWKRFRGVLSCGALIAIVGLRAQSVVINEFMAENESAVINGGDNPDWLELRNTGSATVDLSGWRLSDDPLDPGRFVFPSGTSLKASGYLVVWCDDDNAAPGLHSGFSLNAKGGTLLLSGPGAGGIVDQVSYGLQVVDRSVGRLSGGPGWGLCVPTAGQANQAQTLGNLAGLRFNEWMASPSVGEDWFELHNPDALPVDLSGAFFTDNAAEPQASPVPDLSFLAGEGFLQFWADDLPDDGADHVAFKLSANGETLRLASKTLVPIDSVTFGTQTPDVSEGRLPDGGNQVVKFPDTITPARSNYLPSGKVVINEVLSHTDPPWEDAIELFNPASQSLDLSGWYLSNSPTRPKKYRLPDGFVIPALGYRVIYEYQFNPNPNLEDSFTFNSAHGDEAVLSEVEQGMVTGYRAVQEFPSAANGVAFGRLETSVGTEFASMSQPSFGVDHPVSLAHFRQGQGQANPGPLIGSVVISEIMYHPPPVIVPGATNDNTDDEFIELHNRNSRVWLLYDTLHPENTWRLAGAVDFNFPQGTSIAAGGRLLVVGFDPVKKPALLAAFRERFEVPAEVAVFGPWKGKLDNAGEAVELYQPDPPQQPPHPDAGYVPYILVDRIAYTDTAPWPPEPDGGGASLQRKIADQYGNDPVNWFAAPPTAGRGNATVIVPPQIESVALEAGSLVLSFTAQAGQSYSVQYRANWDSSTWLHLKDVAAGAVTRIETVRDPISTGGARFYRLTSPAVP